MKILDKEIEFDFFDAEQMERYEKESEIAQKELNSIDINKIKMSELINKTCTTIEKCFDNVFAEGTSRKIFEDKRNFRLCVKAFKDLVKAKKEQVNEIDDEIKDFQKELQEIDSEYKPNRSTRRAKK